MCGYCAAEDYDLVCTCRMTEGPHFGELFQHYLHSKKRKVYLFYLFKDNIRVWNRFSLCAFQIVAFTTQKTFIKGVIKLLNKKCHDDLIFELSLKQLES